MKIVWKSSFLIPLFFLLKAIMPVAAQADDDFTPYQQLVLLCVDTTQTESSYYGDICTWSPGDDDIIRETTSHYVNTLTMSPDGTKVAYTFLPEFYVEAHRQGEDLTFGAGPLPASIGIMDLSVSSSDPDRFKIIADQEPWTPEDAGETPLQRRSTPKWSPDSTQLAWIELDPDFSGFGGRIMVHDTHTSTTNIVARPVSLGFADAGMWSIPHVIGWSGVITYTSFNAGAYPNDTSMGGFGTVLDVYDLEGNRTGIAIEYFADFEDRLVSTVWLLHQDRWQIGLYYTQTGWTVFDPVEQTFGLLANPPYIQSITGEGWKGHILSLDTSQSVQIDWRHGQFTADDVTLGIPHTFDPDGNPIWQDAEGHMLTLREGSLEPVVLPEYDGLRIVAFVWTPYVWLTDGEASDIEPAVNP
ncbi:MAG: hypothetical protein L0154_08415 [Chloroflexi bacterium]|nr:hypothetical protein [Chloroflexota bacterium]